MAFNGTLSFTTTQLLGMQQAYHQPGVPGEPQKPGKNGVYMFYAPTRKVVFFRDCNHMCFGNRGIYADWSQSVFNLNNWSGGDELKCCQCSTRFTKCVGHVTTPQGA